MKTVDFDSLYKRELLPQLQPFENRRKKIVANLLRLHGVMLTLIVVAAPVIYFFLHEQGQLRVHPWVGFLVIPVLVVYVGLHAWIKGSYSKDFKAEVVGRLVKAMGPSLEYSPTGSISREEFVRGRLFLTDLDRFRGEDLVQGRVGETEIRFSEIHAEDRRTRTDSKGRTQHYYVTIFRGIYFVADFHKDFQGQTVVLPDVAEKSFGWLGKAMQKMNMRSEKLVHLENPEFEKEFVVYSTNNQQARYILTPSFMESLLAFRRKNERAIHVSFVNSNIHIALSSTKDRFEPWLYKSILNPELLRGFVADIGFLTGIVDDLNLNTRIWSKA
ncbi:MAG: DUF3137 domain-containing protein [Planctomycetota bacterium]